MVGPSRALQPRPLFKRFNIEISGRLEIDFWSLQLGYYYSRYMTSSKYIYLSAAELDACLSNDEKRYWKCPNCINTIWNEDGTIELRVPCLTIDHNKKCFNCGCVQPDTKINTVESKLPEKECKITDYSMDEVVDKFRIYANKQEERPPYSHLFFNYWKTWAKREGVPFSIFSKIDPVILEAWVYE